MGGPEILSPQDEGESNIPDGELELGSGTNTDFDQAFAGTLVSNGQTMTNINVEGIDD